MCTWYDIIKIILCGICHHEVDFAGYVDVNKHKDFTDLYFKRQ